ncbi:MAG: DUF262 domain-containing protein [Hydrogenophaga sp.]|uniref:DUF262 domain-containing protein n=1 Tax=Hydrogenophaga sp. TaxID=1904254 RepID=UPI0027337046|nr:DUF262 domain-containing protein [Hydrogenophaga sp.]MDP3350914.1 DUF262 domain-containing protein [Hydrogenophaga sp.]
MASIEKLEARLDGIGHLLGDRYIEVPPYQRAYSWTDEQVEDLFKDFSDAIRERNAEYFLGTVVPPRVRIVVAPIEPRTWGRR